MAYIERKFGALSSSANPQELSLTVKGAVVFLIPLIVYIFEKNGMVVTQDSLLGLVDAGTAVIASAMVFYGLARKAYYAVTKK